MLRDERDRPPHEALDPFLPESLKKDHRWQALLGIFRQGFQVDIEARFQTVKLLHAALEAVRALPRRPTDAADALQRLWDQLALDPQLPLRQCRNLMDWASNAFLERVRSLCDGSPLRVGNIQHPPFVDAEQATYIKMTLQVSQPKSVLPLEHRIRYQAGSLACAYRLGESDWQAYYVGPQADKDSLGEACKEAAAGAVVESATALHDILGANFANEMVWSPSEAADDDEEPQDGASDQVSLPLEERRQTILDKQALVQKWRQMVNEICLQLDANHNAEPNN